jgi:hypothetical protein
MIPIAIFSDGALFPLFFFQLDTATSSATHEHDAFRRHGRRFRTNHIRMRWFFIFDDEFLFLSCHYLTFRLFCREACSHFSSLLSPLSHLSTTRARNSQSPCGKIRRHGHQDMLSRSYDKWRHAKTARMDLFFCVAIMDLSF